MSIRRLASRTMYENAWMRVREDEIERADGSPGIFGVLEKNDFALIIPREVNGDVWLVEQYRYPVAASFWEFPQGSWEQRPDTDPGVLARAELVEETGLRAGSLRHLGHLYEAYGYSTQGFDVWLATDLRAGVAQRTGEEQDMRSQRFTMEQFREMIQTAQIKDAPSIAAYGLLMLDREREAC